MSELQNDFPSWGETGELPSSGFFYEGGDQVNEKHLDALWHNVQTHFDQTHTAIQDRVRDISGDIILDGGLVVSQGKNTREVDVSASTEGAYVNGQKTGSTSSTTVTLSTNGGTSTRTDSIWVDTSGQIGKNEGSTSVASDQLKVAEIDVASDDTISAVRNKGQDHTNTFASENAPDSQSAGDMWYDLSANDLKSRISGSWRTIATQQWVNNNADVPNADYADSAGDADTVDGWDKTDIKSWVNNNSDVPNADTLDGEHASAFADSGHTHSQLHNKYTDGEARGAVESGDLSRIQFANSEHADLSNLGLGWDNSEGGGGMNGGLIVQDSSGQDAWVVHSSERDYDIQKNGSDGNGVINFKT